MRLANENKKWMNAMTQQIEFKFKHSAFTDADHIKVVRFSGDEGISRLFEFSIELKSSNADIDIDAVLESQASLSISLENDEREIQGIVSSFEAIRQVNNETLYKAVLSPRLWELSLYHTNEIYLEQTVPEIIETVLKEAGFTSLDYDLTGLQGKYKKWPYKCQFGESHLDFISRLMERDGIYYFFTQGDTGEKIIFCDNLQFQEKVANPEVKYSPAASMEINALSSNIHSFVSQQKRLPHKVLLKDFNDDKPSVDIKGEAVIDEAANSSSEIYVWGQNIETPEEGKMLAEVRAEEIRSGKKTYHGESAVVRLIPGLNFTLSGHFRQSCNQDYLLVTINHEGVDPSSLDLSGQSQEPVRVYSNSFMSIAADVQFRSEQLTQKPEINGTLNAFVDSNGTGEYADVDEEGRYRVTLPFDRVDRDGGKASHWIRMSQPFGGENQGMHFPLRKGGAVLLTFIGGDPDRPVIASSIPNASQPSVVNAENHTNSLIKTGAGNKIELEDKGGKNRIKLQTGDNKTYMHLGAPNHPGDGWVVITDGMERKEIAGGQQVTVKTNLPSTAVTTSYANTGNQDGTIFADLPQKGDIMTLRLPGNKAHLFEGKNIISATWEASGVVIEKASTTFPFAAKITSTKYNASDHILYTVSVVTKAPDVFDETVQYSFAPRDDNGGITNELYISNAHGEIQKIELTINDEYSGSAIDRRFTTDGELTGKFLFERTLGDKYVWEQGDEYRFNSPGDKRFQFGADKDVVICQTDKILDNDYVQISKKLYKEKTTSAALLEYEKKSKESFQSNQILNQKLNGTAELLGSLSNMMDNFVGYQSYDDDGSVTGTNKKAWEKSYKKYGRALFENEWNDLLDNKSQIRVAKHNTFNIQNGNIIDFGGYWNYNLGNSYAETHGKQATTINESRDNDLAEVAGPHWKKINGKDLTFTQQGDEQVEKAYSNQYSYTKGDTIEVQKGNTESQHYGNSYDYHDGDSYEEVNGNSESIINGNSKERVTGNSDSNFFGRADSMHLGGTADLFVGGQTSLSFAAKSTMDFSFGFEYSGGIRASIEGGPRAEIKMSPATEVSPAEVKAFISEIKTSANELASYATKVESSAMLLGSGAMYLAAFGLQMLS